MRGPSAVRRMAAVGAVSAALAACLGAGVPAVTLALRLDAVERREAEGRARTAADALAFEREEHGTLAEAVREVLAENAPTTGRLEIWQGSVLVGSRGDGPSPGAGPLRASSRLDSVWVAREGGPEGAVVAVAVPRTASLALRQVLGETLLATVPLIALGAGLLAAFLLRRDLEPLRRLSEDVALARPGSGYSPLPLRSADREIVALTEALNGWQARSASALRRESEFAALAAHALRTPLTRLSAAAASDRGPLGRSVRQLARLVEGLLAHVRVGAPLSSAGVAVNLADVAREAAAPGVVAGSPDAGRIEVVAPEEAFVRGDEALLRSAAEHLLDNALGYTDPAGRIRLTVSPSADGREVALAVVDDGPGPDPAVLARLFEPFVRGEATEGRDGTGLGLALVRRIAEAHGGRAAASREGAGTRFEVVLPAWSPERRPS